MAENDLRQLVSRIEAIEFLLGELAAKWVREQNPGGERKFAEYHADNLNAMLQQKDASPDLQRAVRRLWTQVVQRFPA